MSKDPTTPASGQDAPALAATVERYLRANSHAALHDIRCEATNEAVFLRGRVSSYYLKQLAQEAVRKADGGRVVVNELEVQDRGYPTASNDSSR